MVTRRGVIAGGLSAAGIAAVGGGAALLSGDAGAVRTVGADAAPPLPPAPLSPAPSLPSSGQSVNEVDSPAAVSTPADRLDTPIRVDWVGGSDVAWEAVSLPERFVRRYPTFADRPVEMRVRTRQAVLADGVRELVAEAVFAHTAALVMSINPVWLYWDGVACSDFAVQHERYECLLTPISQSLTAQRDAELGALVDAAVAAGVPLYVYTLPHSTDALLDPRLVDLIEESERRIAQHDPGLPTVRFRARIFTRDMDPPLAEGVDFIDMVHATPDGVKRLGRWLADDITDFWTSIGFGV